MPWRNPSNICLPSFPIISYKILPHSLKILQLLAREHSPHCLSCSLHFPIISRSHLVQLPQFMPVYSSTSLHILITKSLKLEKKPPKPRVQPLTDHHLVNHSTAPSATSGPCLNPCDSTTSLGLPIPLTTLPVKESFLLM